MPGTKNLKMNFNSKALLEIKTSEYSGWEKTNPYIFRTWGGERRIDGQEFNGDIYYLGTNKIVEKT